MPATPWASAGVAAGVGLLVDANAAGVDHDVPSYDESMRPPVVLSTQAAIAWPFGSAASATPSTGPYVADSGATAPEIVAAADHVPALRVLNVSAPVLCATFWA